MVVRTRFRRGEAPSPSCSSLRLTGAALSVFAGCFNPTGTDPSAGPDVTGPATSSTPSTTSPTGSTGSTDPTTDELPTSTGPSSDSSGSTTGPACGDVPECPADAPVCDAGTCVCTDGDQCPVDAPVCDPQTRSCRGCRYHHECDIACDIAEGRCFPPDTRELIVVPSDACGDCGNGIACCSVNQAIAVATKALAPYVVIRLTAGSIDDTAVDLTGALGDSVLAIVGGAPNATLKPTIGAAMKIDQSGSPMPPRIYLWRLQLAGNLDTSGLDCRSATLWLDETDIRDHAAGPGLLADACDVTIHRSTIVGNSGSISTVNAADLVLRNVVVGGSPLVSELFLGPSTRLDARYVTVVDESAGAGSLIQCQAPNSVAFGNAIVLGTDEVMEVSGCDGKLAVANSVATGPLIDLGRGNTYAVVGQVPLDAGYRLAAPNGLPEGVAIWRTGDPPTDIDGAPRPTSDNTPDYAGADLP